MTWISVKDKLPELNQEVLVYVKGITYNSDPYKCIDLSYITECYSERFILENTDWVCKLSSNETVTHWMPLPEPPRDET